MQGTRTGATRARREAARARESRGDLTSVLTSAEGRRRGVASREPKSDVGLIEDSRSGSNEHKATNFEASMAPCTNPQ